MNKNHHTSRQLLLELEDKDTFSCGTIRVLRGQFLENFKKKKLERGENIDLNHKTFLVVH